VYSINFLNTIQTCCWVISNAKVSSKDVSKPTVRNESLLEIRDDNGVRIVNFTISKNLTVKSTVFPHLNREN
jgi:hypothetical protein